MAAQDSAAVRSLPLPEIHGFIEVYYRAGDPLTKDGYRLRKSDLKFSGQITPRLRWRVGFDASKALVLNETKIGDSATLADVAVDQRSRILQDAALTLALNHHVTLDVGQQLIPLSLEGTIPTANVETVERTNFIVERSRGVGLGDVRDIGASINGVAAGALEYHAGLFNETGDAQGTTDTNDQKALVGRAAYHVPWLPGFQFGGSGAFEGGPPAQHRERAGGEIQYQTPLVTLRAENMGARDGGLHRYGWYTLGAVRLTPPLQLVARYDAWDRDLSGEHSLADAFERQIVVGGSYLVDGAASRFVLNIVRQTFPNVHTIRDGTFALIAFEAGF